MVICIRFVPTRSNMNSFSRVCDVSKKKQLFLRAGDILRRIVTVPYSQKVEKFDLGTVSDDAEYYEDDWNVNELDIEKKQNKSHLRPAHKNMLHNFVPYSEPKAWFHYTVKYKQKMYGVYGKKSAVNPGILWPTREQIEEIREYESVAYPDTLQEMIKKCVQANLEKEQIVKEREREIESKMAKLEQWKKEVNERIRKKEDDAMAAKAKKDRLVEEVRQHFGYKIDPRDERFKELLEKKEKEDKKLAKEAKRKEREAKTLAKLTELGMKAASAASKQE